MAIDVNKLFQDMAKAAADVSGEVAACQRLRR